MTLRDTDDEFMEHQRDRIRDTYLSTTDRPRSTAQGVHHIALLSSDVERTVDFYQELLGFPLTEIHENRDYQGSHQFFFDIGHGNLLAFFDVPGLDLGPYKEVLGGLHHLAISVSREQWEAAKERLDAAGIGYLEESGASLYFSDPDGTRLELLAAPLGKMYGRHIL